MSSHDEAARALLGSALLVAEENHNRITPAPASSGNYTIDKEALDEGFRYGEITSIAGPTGTGKTTLAYQAIASHLMAHDAGEIALIATTELSLARIRDVLAGRIATQDQGPEFQESRYLYRKQPSTKQAIPETSHRVMSMLERVHICRVFDFAGVEEAVTEFGANLEDNDRSDEVETTAKERKSARSVADSEDEAEEDVSLEPDGRRHGEADITNPAMGPGRLRAHMIVIDNMANVVGSMMAKSQVQGIACSIAPRTRREANRILEGHAILARFMRSLRHLTKHRHICTLIVNAAVGLRPQGTQYRCKADDQVSIFASTTGRPALGKHFTSLVDASIYLSTLPRSKEDADVAYGDVRGALRFNEIRVLEVLKDRYGSREGKWSAFDIIAGTGLQSVRLCE
ncbi:MAG: hypothetical protein Q9196_002620 [Gyalolechia fulgens]